MSTINPNGIQEREEIALIELDMTRKMKRAIVSSKMKSKSKLKNIFKIELIRFIRHVYTIC